MAGTKAQAAAKQRRIDRAAESLYMVAEPRAQYARLMFKSWKELKKVEKDRYRSMVMTALEAYQASPPAS